VTAALIIAGAVAAGLLVAGLTIYFAQDDKERDMNHLTKDFLRAAWALARFLGRIAMLFICHTAGA
jgi:hypothetical protein